MKVILSAIVFWSVLAAAPALVSQEIPSKKEIVELDNSVLRIDGAINHLVKQHAFERVIVYGHSEGAPIGAKLATVNNSITHLGF